MDNNKSMNAIWCLMAGFVVWMSWNTHMILKSDDGSQTSALESRVEKLGDIVHHFDTKLKSTNRTVSTIVLTMDEIVEKTQRDRTSFETTFRSNRDAYGAGYQWSNIYNLLERRSIKQ